MRKRKLNFFEDKEASVDMTPMLDIVFILLIFFIVTTSFVKEKGFLVGKDEASKQTSAPSENIMIHIDQNDIVYFNNKAVDVIRIPARVEYFTANHATENILLRPHAETNYQKVVEVLDQLQQFRRLQVTMGTYKQ